MGGSPTMKNCLFHWGLLLKERLCSLMQQTLTFKSSTQFCCLNSCNGSLCVYMHQVFNRKISKLPHCLEIR